VIDSLEVKPEAMRRATVEGFLNATELADYLVARGVPFRDAHHLVGRIVLRAQELNQTLEQLPLPVYRSFSPVFKDDLYSCLKLENVVSRRREKGGTAPAAFRSALKRFRKRLEEQ
jgi:argininosuccinate lyase